MDADGLAWVVAGVAVAVAAGLLLAAVLMVGRQVVVRWYARRLSRWLRLRRARARKGWRAGCCTVAPSQGFRCNAKKPDWVVKEVLRLSALMPGCGCRLVAACFNRCYARRGVSVGKSFVYQLMCRYRYEIAVLAHELKHRVPPPMPVNRVWGIDLTGKQDAAGAVHSVLGVVDHGSRRALCLQVLRNKASLTLLRTLLSVIERFGLPQAIRSDNEAIFTSRLFRFGLWWLGIRHQRTVPGCPWQNGRVERLFGTLKAKLDRWQVSCFAGLQVALAEFGFWYNEVRPHQHLGGATPVEAWQGVAPFLAPVKEAHFFSAWDGLLTGFYLRR